MPHPKPQPAPEPASLHTPPSWHNRAGRVDRSSCFTLTAAALWRSVPNDRWRNHKTYHPAPHADAEESATKRQVPKRPDRSALITLTAEHLWLIHREQRPAPLRGDFRTTKSNAFKPAAQATAQRQLAQHLQDPQHNPPDPPDAPGHLSEHGIWHGQHSDPTHAPQPLRPSNLDPPAINPNRGVGFDMHLKMLGLPADWTTTLTLERYPQHAQLKQHFLVCPVCGGTASHTGETQADSRRPTDAGRHASARAQASGVRRPPAVLTHDHTPAARKTPTRGPGLPPGRVTKLYLPLCTPREWEDAQFVHLWLQSHTNPNRPYSKQAQRLIQRYAELFPSPGGRKLRCRQCLGLRYGEVKRRKK